MKGKIYRIKYTLSNNKTEVFFGKRDKVIKQWEKHSLLTKEQIAKQLKIKDKTITLVEMSLYDWAGNSLAKISFSEGESKVV
jgi:hypothetical protein